MSKRPDSILRGSQGPGYLRAPDHRVAMVPRTKSVRAAVGGHTVAQATDTVVIEESGYPAQYYLARAEVDMSLLELEPDYSTYCPFKGQASYYAIRIDDHRIERAAWSYEQTYREVELIRDRICFDGDKVEVVT